jgi:hypothetical protein
VPSRVAVPNDSPAPSAAELAPRQGVLALLQRLNRRTCRRCWCLTPGVSGLAAIAETLWVRESLGLSAPALLALAP